MKDRVDPKCGGQVVEVSWTKDAVMVVVAGIEVVDGKLAPLWESTLGLYRNPDSERVRFGDRLAFNAQMAYWHSFDEPCARQLTAIRVLHPPGRRTIQRRRDAWRKEAPGAL